MASSTAESLTEVPLDSNVSVNSTQPDSAEENKQNEASSGAGYSPPVATAYPPQQPPSQPSSANVEANTDPNKGHVAPLFKSKKDAFYSARPGLLERALEETKRSCYNANVDGMNLLGAWLLMEVDHWDSETEKIVLLYDETLLTVRYDFVPMKVYKAKKLFLKDVDTIKHGPFTYPKFSLCNVGSSDFRRRRCEGVRLLWNRGVIPNFFERWDSSSRSMPWQTFTFHPLYECEESTTVYDAIDFKDKVIQAVLDAHQRNNTGMVLNQCSEAIRQDIYLGLLSKVHNDSFLGMSKERGGFSF